MYVLFITQGIILWSNEWIFTELEDLNRAEWNLVSAVYFVEYSEKVDYLTLLPHDQFWKKN